MKKCRFTKKESIMKWNRVFGCLAVGAMFWACSDNDGKDVVGGASGDSGITAVTDWEVAGVSQKGPFVTGSAVTVQELDGITLKQTGKSFKGSIKSDKGDFAIKDINLGSQYAILEATGYYRDEISGKKSSGMVTLRALTDLSDRKKVNINLLTHLEYERVMYLVNKKKKSIAEAKAQAEEEVLASFAIEGDFGESEDLNIFESGDGNAALLAVSVLMQSDVDVAGLTERIGEFSISLAEGGSWDDADAKTAIADWACDIDLKGSLSKVRKNVEGWKYADTVPAFEKYVSNFWWDNYGLGVCNDKRENETKRNVNKLSKLYNEYFVCENGRWVIPGDEPKSSSSMSSQGDASSSSESGEPVFGTLTDARDGKVYKTVKLGSQEWMAENLNYAVEGSMCYDDNSENCKKFGRLYNLVQVLDTTEQAFERGLSNLRLRSDFHPRQGVCPDGWHVPEEAEWDTLFAFAEKYGDGESLSSSLLPYDWDDYHEKLNASNKFGLDIIGAGVCRTGEGCIGLDSLTYLWTATITEPNYIMMYSFGGPLALLFKQKPLPYAYTGMYVTELHYASVRCVKGEGKKRKTSGESDVESSSSGVASSSSVVNPFISSSSRPETHDTIPELPDEIAFLESFFDEYQSYVTFENEKQKNWVISKLTELTFSEKDSLLVKMGDSLSAHGFEYVGKTLIDDAFCLQNGDSSYAYVKNVAGLVYKIYVRQRARFDTMLLGAHYGYDLKIVALENGMEERLSVNCKSLKYEKELPEEVRFIGEFGDYSNKQGWSDDSLMTFWFVDGWTHDSWRDTATCAAEGRSEIETRLDEIKSALVEKGFTLVKDGPVEVSSRYYTHSSVLVQDGRIQVSFYEMETEKALYKLEVYSGVSEGGDVFAPIYRYMFFVDIRTYYKRIPE